MSEVVVISARSVRGDLFINPLRIVRDLWRLRSLVWSFTARDLRARYRGSFLGVLWTVLTPLAMLATYTFVFSVVLKGRWEGKAGTFEFALALFCGLIIYGVFSECATVAPHLVVNNRVYVKKTTFPLEVLPVVGLLSALFRAGAGMLVLVVTVAICKGGLHWSVLLCALPFIPMALLTLGVGWFLAALGTFVRDAAHTVALLVHLVFFMTPIVYPVSAVPERLRVVIQLNPFTHLVEALRRLVLSGQMPDWAMLGATTAFALVVAVVGYTFFAASRKAFADVL